MREQSLSHEEVRDAEHVLWLRSVPFIAMHLIPLLAIWTGVSVFDVALCVALYGIRMFFITGGFHRYFSHRTFKTSRVMQFMFAFCAQTSAQKGTLWWAAHHRHHHLHSDEAEDIHSPLRGFWWSHVGWIICGRYDETRWSRIRDFSKYPELMWLNRFHWVPAAALGFTVWALWGWSAFLIGFMLSTVLLYHGTFVVNSLTHVFGRKRYQTGDESRNSFLIALITLGEGWHNNHHHHQTSARQGFMWWELDMTYYVLKMMSWIGLVWDLQVPPAHVVAGGRIGRAREALAAVGGQLSDTPPVG
jgi:stearoyl-CoA desaturase (delta-9 desaturase)